MPDRKRVREALRESEERFRSLVESTDNAVYLIDRNLCFLYANKKYLSRHGFTVEKIMGLEYEKFHSAEETAEFAGIVRKVIESGVSITYEHANKKDGKFFLRTISPLRELRGREVTEVTVISKDITERKRTEEEVRDLARFPSENPGPVLRLNSDGIILYANKGSQAVLRNWGCMIGSKAPAFWCGVVKEVHASRSSRTVDLDCDGKTYSFFIAPVPDAVYVNLYGLDITQRKRTEQMMRDSEMKYRNLFEYANDAIFIADAETGYIQDANKEAERLLGRSREEIVNRHQSELHPPDKADFYKERFSRHIETGRIVDLDSEVIRKDGTIVPVSISAGTVEIAGRKLIQGIFSDLSMRKRMEEELRERVKQLTCLYAVKRDIQKDLSVDELCGRVVDQLVSATQFPEITVPVIELDDRRFTNDRYTEGLSDGLHAEIRIGGEAHGYVRIYYTEEKPFIIPDESNLVNGVAEAISLWLEHKMVEEALQESKEFAENLIASMQDGISVLDSDGVHIGVNAAFCQMTGFSRKELIGVGMPHPYWPPEADEEIEKAFQKTLRGEFGEVELTFMRKNGERFPAIVNPSWVMDKQGNVASYFATVKDITERKRAEAEREELLADLKAKNKEMEAFVYTVSHDLKSPLVSLGGFSSALKKEYESQLGEEGKHYLERIQANIVQMGNLITNLLEVSRLGRTLGPIEEIDVAALLREIRGALAIKLKEVGAEFVVQEPLPIVRADRSSIYQVFVNLIDNALKFRGTDRVLRIEVGCRQESGFYRFHVADNGIGIGPESHEQIFAPFRKLHLEIEGAGIGLALVKKIVENHGGRVWVESPSTSLRAGNEGAGATFYFTLPMGGRTHSHS